jgi:hypothetical protein
MIAFKLTKNGPPVKAGPLEETHNVCSFEPVRNAPGSRQIKLRKADRCFEVGSVVEWAGGLRVGPQYRDHSVKIGAEFVRNLLIGCHARVLTGPAAR